MVINNCFYKQRVMRKLTCIFIFCFALFTNPQAISQEKNITGQVVAFDSIPVVSAVVQIRSTKQTILTDSSGRFEAVVQPNDKVTISAKGFYSQKLKIEGNKKIILVNLNLKSGARNAEIALISGHITNSERFMSARELHNDVDMDFSQYTTFFQLIEGRFPNVEVRSGEIIIRGEKSLTSSSSALIVLNGVPSDFSVLSSLSPANIKSVEIVTGTPAMRYGPGAGNGVILIVTKGT
jgi:hypothetical protein